jgi:hypothetical protein
MRLFGQSHLAVSTTNRLLGYNLHKTAKSSVRDLPLFLSSNPCRHSVLCRKKALVVALGNQSPALFRVKIR